MQTKYYTLNDYVLKQVEVQGYSSADEYGLGLILAAQQKEARGNSKRSYYSDWKASRAIRSQRQIGKPCAK